MIELMLRAVLPPIDLALVLPAGLVLFALGMSCFKNRPSVFNPCGRVY